MRKGEREREQLVCLLSVCPSLFAVCVSIPPLPASLLFSWSDSRNIRDGQTKGRNGRRRKHKRKKQSFLGEM